METKTGPTLDLDSQFAILKLMLWKRRELRAQGYRVVPGMVGYRLGYSELLIHSRMAGKEVRQVVANGWYAYVWTTDGYRVDGCGFMVFPHHKEVSIA